MVGDSVMRFRTDHRVRKTPMLESRRWQRSFTAAIREDFTHIVIESGQPLLGTLHRNDLGRDIALLREWGKHVALLFHGSDVRLPSRHAAQFPFSPYPLMDEATRGWMELQARARADLAMRFDGHVFVPTPDLLMDVPMATWLPLVIEPDRWRTERAMFSSKVPVVVHSPSNSVIKRSDLIDPVLQSLDQEGVIEYVRLEGVPNSEVVTAFGRADIVVDTVGIGTCGVVPLEAMAASAVVVSAIPDQVRNEIRARTGFELPIVSTPPDAVRETVLQVLDDRAAAVDRVAAGLEFVNTVHDGRRSAEALRPFLGV